MSTNIEKQFEGALHAFQSEHGTLPEKIFFYRDGVSKFVVCSTVDNFLIVSLNILGDGQIEYVHSTEVVRLNAKLEQMYRGSDKTPKMTFIVVNKRINTRIFSKNGASVDNPVSGTIVDSESSKIFFDNFF